MLRSWTGEQQFLVELNDAAVGDGSIDEVGLVVYATTAVPADLSPDAGEQAITAPDPTTNFDTVVDSTFTSMGSATVGGVSQFTANTVGTSTNFAAALAEVRNVVDASSNGTNVVVFLSDGRATAGTLVEFRSHLTALASQGVVVNSVAIGGNSSCTTGGSRGTLQEMATRTGGRCFRVVNPGALPDIIPDLVSSSLDSLEIEIDGGGLTPIPNSDIDLDLPQLGAVGVAYSTPVNLNPGVHEICVTANGSDPSGSDSVTQCETVDVLDPACPWPIDGVMTIAKGQKASNNEKVFHHVLGRIIGGAEAYGPKASRITICEGTRVTIDISETEFPGIGPIVTPLSSGIVCSADPGGGCEIDTLTSKEKYKAVSADGTDTDRVTLIPGP